MRCRTFRTVEADPWRSAIGARPEVIDAPLAISIRRRIHAGHLVATLSALNGIEHVVR